MKGLFENRKEWGGVAIDDARQVKGCEFDGSMLHVRNIRVSRSTNKNFLTVVNKR